MHFVIFTLVCFLVSPCLAQTSITLDLGAGGSTALTAETQFPCGTLGLGINYNSARLAVSVLAGGAGSGERSQSYVEWRYTVAHRVNYKALWAGLGAGVSNVFFKTDTDRKQYYGFALMGEIALEAGFGLALSYCMITSREPLHHVFMLTYRLGLEVD